MIMLGLLAIPLCLPCSVGAQTTINAATCSQTDVQTAINSAVEGNTVIIPAGNCPWTSGVTISGKGITVQGAGAGRVVAYSLTPLTIGTGAKSLTISPTNVTNTMPSLSVSQPLTLIENGFLANFMQGTVSGFNSSTGALTTNITSAGGTCGASAPANTMQSNCRRWLVVTAASTTLTNNLSSGQMFAITEDTSFHTTVTGIHFGKGLGAAEDIKITRAASGGVAVLIHDNFFEQPGGIEAVDLNTNRGVIWNNSFVASPFNGQVSGVRVKDASNTAMPFSWTTPSTMGIADATGQNNLYVETNDFHAYIGAADWDDNARAVFRYNFLNNAGLVDHGADTSWIGMRHLEFYNNVGTFQAYTDGTTANINWWQFFRGGTLVFFNNNLPAISSQDWGTKSDINAIVMNLNRSSGANPCWGAGTSNGADYHSPRQIGMGYVTGNGTDGLGRKNDSYTYVGDSEPVYIWGNTRTATVGLSDYFPTQCTNPDHTSNYFVLNRDYFTAAKPGYTPYTYPHPLTLGSGSGTKPAPPTGLTAIVN